MNNDLPTIRISKTDYTVEESSTLDNGDLCYTLRAGNAKKTKSLIGRPGDWFLWSSRNGMRGPGLPKPVEPVFDILAAV